MDLINESWKPLFENYKFNLDGLDNDGIVYPAKEHIFRVFEMPVDEIRLVLLGQDPYHNPGEAHGLSFSVPGDVKIPPSLKNIYKELNNEFPDRDYKFVSGNLEKWFYNEKIFLLNSALTVIKNKPNSHSKMWEDFTNDTIKYISENNDKCVYLLLGNNAKSKSKFIKNNNNNIITGVHPSPLSAFNGFFNSGIFKKVEEKLKKQINWQN
jgi:uracil-DNA glycosylase